MKILIVGIGKLGGYLAKQLVKEDHEVTLIDKDFSKKNDIINNLDVNYIEGNGLDTTTLIEAGINNIDLLISAMGRDEENFMCSLIGKKLGAKHTIARIRTPEYTNSVNLLKDELGLGMIINPEQMTAASIARTLNIPSALDSTTFFKGKIEVITLKIKEDNILLGMSVEFISKKFGINIIVCAIERNNTTIIPNGKTEIISNDKIHITGTRKDINILLKHMGLVSNKTKNVMIAGGSRIAVYLSRILVDMGMNIKIIETDKNRCLELSEKLPKVSIINGDMSDQEILFEEEIEKADAFVAVTSIDEENIIYSMFARGLNVPKIITKVNHIKLDGVIENSGIDSVVAPHKIASNHILRYLRAMENSLDSSCEAIYDHDGIFEMIEFNILKESKSVGIKISDLKLKSGIIIAGILRGKNIIFPNGNDEIRINDVIVVVNSNNKIRSINDILE